MNSKELQEIIKQHQDGLITDIDLILKLQMPDYVIQNMLVAQKLPAQAFAKIEIGDLTQAHPHDEASVASSMACESVVAQILKCLGFKKAYSAAFAPIEIYGTETKFGLMPIDASTREHILHTLRKRKINYYTSLTGLDPIWIGQEQLIAAFNLTIPETFATKLWLGSNEKEKS